jgi:methyl-accepting chemotaxis protein
MQELVLDGETFNVSITQLLMKCRLFQENRVLLAQPNYDVRSRVSVDSFRMFVDAIGGTEPNITDDNSADLELLSDEFKYSAISTTVAAWRAVHPSLDANTRLITASLDERLQSHDRALCIFDRKVDRLHRAAIEGERAKIVEVVESIQRGKATFLRTAAKDINLAAEQCRTLGRDICAFKDEIGSLREAIAANGAKLKEDLGNVERQVKDCQRQPQKREALADM